MDKSPSYTPDIFNILRAVAMLCVFGIHAVLVLSDYVPAGYTFPFFLYTPAWSAMWILFALSGFLIGGKFYAGQCNTPAQLFSFFKNRLIRIGLPYFFFVALFVLFINPSGSLHLKGTWGNVLTFTFNGKDSLGGLGATWFVSTIMQLYWVAPLFYHIAFKKIPSRYLIEIMGRILLLGFVLRVWLKIIGADWYTWTYTFSPMQWDIFFVPFLANALPDPTLPPQKLKLARLTLLGLLGVVLGCGTYAHAVNSLLYLGLGQVLFPTVITVLVTGICWLFRTQRKAQRAPLALTWKNAYAHPLCFVEGFAVISYSFYLYHSNLLAWLPQAYAHAAIAPTPGSYLWITVGGGFILCTAWAGVMYFFIERTADRLRGKN